VKLAFRLSDLVERGEVIPMEWVPYPSTNVGEYAVPLTNGSVRMGSSYGDVSGDGTISGFDASLILKFRVGLIAQIDEIAADVTGNGSVMAKDAAEILRYVITPNYVFPVEVGDVPGRIASAPRTLTWARNGDAWALTVDDPAGIDGGYLELAIPSIADFDVVSEHVAVNRVGNLARIAFARTDDSQNVLLSVTSGAFAADAPMAMSVVLNEGYVGIGSIVRPVAFALEQNQPNPFNPSTTIRFGLPAEGAVVLAVYSATGQLVRTLVDETLTAGAHDVAWNGLDERGRTVASGVYLYRITWSGAGSSEGAPRRESAVRRMLFVR